MKNKFCFPLSIICTCWFLISSCVQSESNATYQQATSGKELSSIAKVEQGDVVREIIADGVLYSPKTIGVAAEQVAWYWDFTVAWTAEEGTFVKKGDLIAKLDAGRIEQDLTSRRGRLDEAKLNVTQEKIRATDAVADADAEVVAADFLRRKAKLSVIDSDSISEVERKKQLIEASATEANYRKAINKVQSVKDKTAKDVQLANLRLADVQNEYDRLIKESSRLSLRAPVDGILFFPLSPGSNGMQKASPGVSVRVGTTIAEVAEPTSLIARFFVPEVDIAGLVEGSIALVSLDIAQDEVVAGKVLSVGKLASTQSERDGVKSSVAAHNVRQFEVKVSINSLPPNAVPGLTARARIIVAARKNVTRLPLEALMPASSTNATAESNADSKKVVVNMRSKSKGKWEKREVSIGVTSFAFAEVISGLKPGEEVLVNLEQQPKHTQ